MEIPKMYTLDWCKYYIRKGVIPLEYLEHYLRWLDLIWELHKITLCKDITFASDNRTLYVQEEEGRCYCVCFY